MAGDISRVVRFGQENGEWGGMAMLRAAMEYWSEVRLGQEVRMVVRGVVVR